MKKDLDIVDQKFNNFTPATKFNELLRKTENYVNKDEVIKLTHEMKHMNKTLSKFAQTTDVNEKFNTLTREMFE